MDVKKELDKIKFFDVNPNLKSLNTQEHEALNLCIKAAAILDDICLKQVCGDKLKDYQSIIEKSKQKLYLERFFRINGGPWNRFQEDASFLKGVGKKPKGSGLYPTNLTQKEWKHWLKTNSKDAEQFESPVTIIRRKNNKLIAIKYSEFFKDDLKKVSDLILKASKILKTGPLSLYLKESSKALLNNKYRDSEVAWLKTDGYPFEMLIGPTEVYEDGLFGIKSIFESFIGIPDKKMTDYVKSFIKHSIEFDKIISKKLGFSSKGNLTPMVVFNDVFRSGEAAIGRQIVAANLPNDRKIHELYGSKKIFSKTMMEAKSKYINSKAADKILIPKDKKDYSSDTRFLFVLAHEIAHSIGPGLIKRGKDKVSFEKLLGEFHTPLEEAKADSLGFVFIKFLTNKGILSKNLLKPILITEVLVNFSGWRMGFTEAHSLAGLIEYNYMKHHGGIIYNSKEKTIHINTEKASNAYESLAYEIMKVQEKGDREYAKKFIKKWNKIQPEIKILTNKLDNIPLEVHPIFKI